MLKTFAGLAALAAFAVMAAPPAPVLEPAADAPEPKGYVCYRAPKPIAIDGKIDEAAWAAAPWSDAFVDIEGDAKPKPRYRTRMKMLWDDDAFYIAAELEEPHVWANLTEHDSVIFQDNDFEVFVNPDGNGHNYAELELNARNATWDLYLTKPYKDGGKALHGWEIIGLKTAVHVDGTLNDPADKDRGWTAEIAWPWKGLKEMSNVTVPPRDGDRWRINFSRVEWDIDTADGKYTKVKGRPEHNWVWSPQGVVDMHRPERWGYVQFSSAEPGKAVYKPDPTAAARDFLHRIYYAQKRYRVANGNYSAKLSELGLAMPKGFEELTIETTKNGFEAGIGSKSKRISINQEALIRNE